MDINWGHSPVKHYRQSLTSTYIECSSNTVSEHSGRRWNSTTDRPYRRNPRTLPVLVLQLFREKLRWAFQIFRRKTVRTQLTQNSIIAISNYNMIRFEVGLVQLDYVFKSDQQKSKVMAFTFIKNVYKRKKKLQKVLAMLGNFVDTKRKKERTKAFKQIVYYAATRPRLNQYKFAFRNMNKIIVNSQARMKKQAFQRILHRALDRTKVQQTPKMEPSQHILVVSQHHRSRKRSQTIFVKVPLMSERVYLEQVNISTRRKHRRSSSSVRQKVRIESCIYCSQLRRCRYCDGVKFFRH